MAVKSKLSDAERQGRREADRAKAREAVEQLKSSEGWQRWLGLRRHFHRYSLANQLLIALQKPDATRVASFRSWLKLGYCVRRGETAIRIWVPMPPSKRQMADWEANGSPSELRPRTRFRLGPVFDRSQVEPLPPPAEPTPLDPPIVEPEGDDLAWAIPRLTMLVAELECTMVIEAMSAGCGGYFRSSTRTIALAAGSSMNHRVETLVHELGHALLRLELIPDPPLSYAEEELVVESVAFTVCGAIGLDTSGFSIPYLTSWSEEAQMETVERAAGLIDDLAKRIEDAVFDDPVGVASAVSIAGTARPFVGGDRAHPSPVSRSPQITPLPFPVRAQTSHEKPLHVRLPVHR